MWNVIKNDGAQMSNGACKLRCLNSQSLLQSAIVCVVCLIVHDEAIIYKIEAVRTCLKWVGNHLLDCKQQTHKLGEKAHSNTEYIFCEFRG